ncbi:MAG: hypothetical protein NVSMB51_05700 [Solirubrobacteraceae bacterium]
MTQEIQGVVRRLFAAFNAGDLDAMITLSGPEIEIVPLRAALEETSYRGAAEDALPAFWRDTMEVWEEGLFVKVHDIRVLGEQVVVLGRLVGRGTGSGAEVEAELGWVLGLRDGKVASLHTYRAPADALAAVGLWE